MRAFSSSVLMLIGTILLLSPLVFPQSNNYTFPGPDVDLGEMCCARVVSGGHYIGGRADTIYVLRQLGSTYCHKSTDAGKTFGPGVQVNSTLGAVNASLKVDTSGVVYIAYQSGDADIYFTMSTDGGQTFVPAVKVNDDTIPQTGQEKPVIAVNDKGQIFIAWRDQRNSAPQTHQTVFASASHNGGLSFNQNVQINDSTTPIGGGVDIGADDSVVYLIWEPNYSPFLVSRSIDSGQSFPFRNPVGDELWSNQSLALGEGIIGIVFEEIQIINDSIRFTVSFSASANKGQTFSPRVVLDSSGQPQYPSLVFNNGVFYAVWRAFHKRSPSGPLLDHIWFSYSRDSGKTFVPYKDAVPDDTNDVTHDSPSIWVSETEKVYVAWEDTRWDPFFESIRHVFVSVGKPILAKGDLNWDGAITIADVVLELNAVFYGDSFPAPRHRADGNCDWKLSPVDMVILLNRWYWNIPFACD